MKSYTYKYDVSTFLSKYVSEYSSVFNPKPHVPLHTTTSESLKICLISRVLDYVSNLLCPLRIDL